MDFIKHDLGYLRGGEIVEVAIGYAANVRLLDSSNFNNYRLGKQHRYFGGHATRSPVRLNIPSPGHWYVAVDLGGYKGKIRSSARVLPGRLPAFREAPLSSVSSLVRRQADNEESSLESSEREYDVFISHASEDQDEIVRPLAHSLRELGLEVWYSEFSLQIGDSLRRKIDLGLAKSKFGVVVLSQLFFAKNWTNYELDGLVTRSVTGEQILLPIWHKVSKQEVVKYSPSLADKLARNTAMYTVQEIAKEIAEVIKGV